MTTANMNQITENLINTEALVQQTTFTNDELRELFQRLQTLNEQLTRIAITGERR